MKRVGEWFLHALCAAYRPFRRLADPARSPLRTIAVVSNTALGDTLLSTAVVASVRASFPQARIVFVVHPRYRLLFEGLEVADEVMSYDGGYGALPLALVRLRIRGPDAVLLAHSNGPQDIPLAWLSGAPIILKPNTRSPFKSYLSAAMPERSGHVIEERCNLVRALGGRRIVTRMQLPARYQGPPPPETVTLPHPTVGLQLGAANAYKQWPVERFAALAQRLTQTIPGVKIVLTGAPRERRLAETFKRKAAGVDVIDTTGCFAVEDLPWLFRQFDLLVTNDTGPMHLAIALGVPTVSLFGMTSAAAIGPYQDPERHVVIEKTGDTEASLPKKRRSNRGMLLITVDEVLAAVTRLLSLHASTAHH